MKLKREVKIGLFALAMLLCLYLGVNYLKGKDVFSSDRTYYALFDQTKGLQTSSAVTLRGVKIGSVSGISIDPEESDKVVVAVSIKKSINIPTDSKMKLRSDLLSGSSIELIRGTSDNYFERDAVIPAETQSNPLESASNSLEDLVSEFKRTLNSLEATSSSLNTILEQNTDNIRGTMDNLNSTTKQLADAKVGKMLKDLGEFTSMLKDNSARFDNIIGNLDGVSESLAEADLKATIDTLGMSIGRFNSVMAGLSEGEGTAGMLLQDPALYDSLVTASGNLAALLEDLKANPRRYVHFSIFGRRDKENK